MSSFRLCVFYCTPILMPQYLQAYKKKDMNLVSSRQQRQGEELNFSCFSPNHYRNTL